VRTTPRPSARSKIAALQRTAYCQGSVTVQSLASLPEPGITQVDQSPAATGIMTAMIGRLHHVVLDCPRPLELAAFYSQLLGQPITHQSDDWVVVAASDTASGLAFQLDTVHRRSTWPDPAVPQQFHLDIMVEDPDASGPRVVALGATNLDGEDIYADLAGHPFCLVRRPDWAQPIPDGSCSGGRNRS
jgi:catechol 2,3-dioxygenase-like lactoylglutathione lyase family enzyme